MRASIGNAVMHMDAPKRVSLKAASLTSDGINSSKISWLTGKWKIERIGLTAQEMQDLEHKQFSIEQIFQLHSVPLTVAGIREAANYATAEIDDQRFRTYTAKVRHRIFPSTPGQTSEAGALRSTVT